MCDYILTSLSSYDFSLKKKKKKNCEKLKLIAKVFTKLGCMQIYFTYKIIGKFKILKYFFRGRLRGNIKRSFFLHEHWQFGSLQNVHPYKQTMLYWLYFYLAQHLLYPTAQIQPKLSSEMVLPSFKDSLSDKG